MAMRAAWKTTRKAADESDRGRTASAIAMMSGFGIENVRYRSTET